MAPGRHVGLRHKSAGRDGAVWRRIREIVLGISDVCGICGHPGSNDVEHIISRSEAPELAEDLENFQPAHGANSMCFICDPDNGRNCNGEKGSKSMEIPLVTTEEWLD